MRDDIKEAADIIRIIREDIPRGNVILTPASATQFAQRMRTDPTQAMFEVESFFTTALRATEGEAKKRSPRSPAETDHALLTGPTLNLTRMVNATQKAKETSKFTKITPLSEGEPA